MVRRQRTPLITIPKPLRDKLGDEGFDALIAVLNEQEKETENSVIETAGLRFEKKLAEEISPIRVDLAESEGRFEKKMVSEVSAIRVDLTEAEGRFEKKLTEEISSVKVLLSDSEKKFEKNITSVRTSIADLDKRFNIRLTHEISGLREEMIRGDSMLAEAIHKSSANNTKWKFIF